MKKSILLATVLVTLLTAAAPVLAQSVGASASPSDAVLEGDTLVIGGDVTVDCGGAARYVELYGGAQPGDPAVRDTLAESRMVLEQCQEAGFDLADSATASASASPVASTSLSAAGGGGTLPETGGPAPFTLLPGAALLLVAGAVLATRARR